MYRNLQYQQPNFVKTFHQMYSSFVTTIPSTSNASLDKVVFQIERLSGQINIVSIKVDETIKELSARGQQTASSLINNFNKDTIQNMKRMLHVISAKIHNWPLTALIIVGITALILIVIMFLFFLAKGGEKIVQKRYKKKITLTRHDIENL